MVWSDMRFELSTETFCCTGIALQKQLILFIRPLQIRTASSQACFIEFEFTKIIHAEFQVIHLEFCEFKVEFSHFYRVCDKFK